MSLHIHPCTAAELPGAAALWNAAVAEGLSLPQTEPLTEADAEDFLLRRQKTAVAIDADSGEVLGLCCLSRAFPGRASGVAACCWAVTGKGRGLRADEQLLLDALGRARQAGFRLMTVPAVPATNGPALKLLRRLGFAPAGSLPGAFRLPDGSFTDLTSHCYPL